MTPQSCLSKLLLFGKVDFGGERRIAAEMYERSVVAGEILIKEGDTGTSFPSFLCLSPKLCKQSPCDGPALVPKVHMRAPWCIEFAGLGASELYVVKSGEFEVLERRQGINMRVNSKTKGDCFGEVSLMYSCPRSATVAATTNATVWVLERQIFR